MESRALFYLLMFSRMTRKRTAAIQAMTTDLNKELSLENTALAKVIEETMARYFKEADEKSDTRHNRLEKRLDSMQSVLTRHTEEMKTLHADTSRLQEHVLQAEVVVDEHLIQVKVLTAKLIEMEDGALRLFPALASAPSELMRAHQLIRPRTIPAGKGLCPRLLIINSLRFSERDALLKEAWRNPPEVAGALLKFAADDSEHTSKLQRACYQTMHEARLKDSTHFFCTPPLSKYNGGMTAIPSRSQATWKSFYMSNM